MNDTASGEHCTFEFEEMPVQRRQTILVVDDNPELCHIASLVLRHCGYRVLSANGPDAAREVANGNSDVDLLLTDVEMPGMQGDDLARWFQIKMPWIAVVFMSGNPMQRGRLRGFPFIEKPFAGIDALVEVVRATLNSTNHPN